MGRPRKYTNDFERENAKKESKKKWAKKNKETVSYIRAKSFTKYFIEMAKDEDLKLIENWLNDRKKRQ